MMFVECTTKSGKKILVNLDTVETIMAVEPDDGCTIRFNRENGAGLYVKNSYKDFVSAVTTIARNRGDIKKSYDVFADAVIAHNLVIEVGDI